MGDLSQAYALFEKMRGVTMAKSVGRGGGVDAALGASQAKGVLHRRHREVRGGPGRGFGGGVAAFAPADARTGKHPDWMLMLSPPLAQTCNHARAHRHVTIVSTFAWPPLSASGSSV